MPDMLINEKEFPEWLSAEPHLIPPLLQGYREAISDMGYDLLTDPRSSRNTHIVNCEFVTLQQYFMGFQYTPGQHEFVISCLYVFPMFRNLGLGTHLINSAKQFVQDNWFIHVSVEKHKIYQLDSFYRRQGFVTTNDIFTNPLGMAYKDYFWSGKDIELIREGNRIAVKPLP